MIGLKFSKGFLKGGLCIFKGLKEISTDFRIFLYTIFPFCLGIGIITLVFYYGWSYSSEYLRENLLNSVGSWIGLNHWFHKFIFWGLDIIFKIFLSLIIFYVGFIFIQLMSIPFYSLICERILIKRKVFPQRDFKISTWIRTNLRLFLISLVRMLIFSFGGIVVFIFSFLPGVGFIVMYYAALVLALDSMDYTFETYELGLIHRFGIYFSNIPYFLGLSLFLTPFLFIPGLTLIILPISVVGSAVVFAESLEQK